ncbi:prune homolog (Drosophila) [Seminavis robusta]|uniref:Prune homolog (Drosophila) n=1 Tax=Seminavis robusta TaxID=568900 RepID=A0A9N8DGZ0_9STRA|nr:prune homolog (Drosophila) [Seminavis robusta]|eukprot:Sro147_g067870.1 prune homolog (Drosophila) (520) ;mRNA; f:58808-60367
MTKDSGPPIESIICADLLLLGRQQRQHQRHPEKRKQSNRLQQSRILFILFLLPTIFCLRLSRQGHSLCVAALSPPRHFQWSLPRPSTKRMSAMTNKGDATAIGSFENFLAKTRAIESPNHVVVGNAAGDADSIISALTLAYIDSDALQKRMISPVVSITQQDLETQRPEVSFLFRTVGLEQSVVDTMRFIDDPVITTGNNHKKKKLTLVDHNRAEVIFSPDCWDVVEILDHHFDENQHTETCSGDQRNIAFANDKATVASTCTLIAERLLQQQKQNSNNNKYHPTVATLLLGTILLDSVNMIPAAGKGTPRDATAIQNLLENTDWSLSTSAAKAAWSNNNDNDGRPDTTQLFESLQAAKFDPAFWNGLSVPDALRLDYKRFSTSKNGTVFGASAVLLPMADFIKKPQFQKGIREYMTQTANVELLAILFFFTDDGGENRRQLCVCGSNEKVVDEMISHLQEDGTLDLQEIVENDNVCWSSNNNGDDDDVSLVMRMFDQRNAKASRKQVAPLMIKFFESR